MSELINYMVENEVNKYEFKNRNIKRIENRDFNIIGVVEYSLFF